VRLFYARNQRYTLQRWDVAGESKGSPDFLLTGVSTLLRLAASFDTESVRFEKLQQEATAMVATTPTRPEFIDTYWIIPEYATEPYGKVSFTRQDCRTFTANYLDLIKKTLPVWGNAVYSNRALVNPSAGFDSPIHEADVTAISGFFASVITSVAPLDMVGRSGGAERLAGFFVAGLSTLLRLASLFDSRVRGLKEPTKEATAMVATTPTRPEFIDTYWIIPEYATEPYGKVSFTRQDCRTFHSMFKNSRLIWCGRKSMHAGMEEN